MELIKEIKSKDLHNLKSTLTAVIGYIQMAQNKIDKFETEDVKHAAALLKKSLESAEKLEKQIIELEGISEPLLDL